MVTFKVDRSETVQEAKNNQLWYVYVVAFIVAVLACIAAFIYGQKHLKIVSIENDIRWCQDVYHVVNPEKLQDSTFCRRTILKYREGDRLWALHRKLGREYESVIKEAQFEYSLPPSLS